MVWTFLRGRGKISHLLGPLNYFLGNDITKHKNGISYPKENMSLIRGQRLENWELNHIVHQWIQAYKLQLLNEDDKLFEDHEKYRMVAEKLNYLTMTQPDITYFVSLVNQVMSSHTVKHWTALRQILYCLKGTSGLGLLYEDPGHTNIEWLSDAD